MWNHLVRFNGQAYEAKYRNLNVDASGRAVAGHRRRQRAGVPVLGHQPRPTADTYWRIKLTYTGPARRAGEALMIVDPLDIGTEGPPRLELPARPAPREGRARPVATTRPTPAPPAPRPSTTPSSSTARWTASTSSWSARRRCYVPYNAYGAVYQAKQDDLLKPNHLNPDLVRWELHRVWVVEATLREGKRHVYSKRTFYLDEDSWAALASRQVRRTRPAVPRRLRLHGAELRPAGAVHRHVRPLRLRRRASTR